MLHSVVKVVLRLVDDAHFFGTRSPSNTIKFKPWYPKTFQIHCIKFGYTMRGRKATLAVDKNKIAMTETVACSDMVLYRSESKMDELNLKCVVPRKC